LKNLKDILYKVTIDAVFGSTEATINTIQFDSRRIEANDVFVALKGVQADGHLFITKAIDLGAKTIICEQQPENINKSINYIIVKDSHSALAIMASNFFGNPSEKLKLVGVTGTNGKTTVASLLFQLFYKADYSVGLLSTVEIKINDSIYKATHTTPNPLEINFYLNKMVQEGVQFCFMEVSSHGIDQKRIEGLHFEGGLFTNITHDHLDYHKTFKTYLNVKKAFFDYLPKTAFALVNIDDKNGKVMLQNTKATKSSYSLNTIADFKGKIIENSFEGMLLSINDQEVWARLVGEFNAYNLLAVYGTAVTLGVEPLECLRLLSELKTVNGRFDYFVLNGITAIVDYAHTPDALENVIKTINTIRTGNEQLITVVGCGGDRDVNKRPKMGNIAAHLSTQSIFTSDNPRSEDPNKIILDMEAGVLPQDIKKTLSITDRKQAIKTAVKLAAKGDIILIAGKGHETYQIIKDQTLDFDDYKTIKKLLTD
jgi:UDP-N-acetylmuramoyl-L-alanyl-D-glutamate--2,6-diaminopimelate ligase